MGVSTQDTPTSGATPIPHPHCKMAFQTALQFWKEFNILDLQVFNSINILLSFINSLFQHQLDGEAAEVARRQDESDASVKRLVDLSREFKRSTTEVYK